MGFGTMPSSLPTLPVREEKAGGREGGKGGGEREGGETDRHTDREICSANGVSIQPAKYCPSCSANGVSIQPANTVHPGLQKSFLSNL